MSSSTRGRDTDTRTCFGRSTGSQFGMVNRKPLSEFVTKARTVASRDVGSKWARNEWVQRPWFFDGQPLLEMYRRHNCFPPCRGAARAISAGIDVLFGAAEVGD